MKQSSCVLLRFNLNKLEETQSHLLRGEFFLNNTHFIINSRNNIHL
jgi:hypothetical protein